MLMKVSMSLEMWMYCGPSHVKCGCNVDPPLFSGSCMVSYLIASINLMIKLELLLISLIIIIGM